MSEVIIIDANVLKEIWELYKNYQPSLATNVYEFGVALKELIDNAPTVETDIEVATKDAYEQGYAQGWKERFGEPDERSQGEWVYGEDEYGQDGWFCSECGFFVPWYYTYYENDIDFIREYKACPDCLAKMITYTGKDRDTKGGE